MNPGLQCSVEKLLPVRSDLENQRSAKKEMFIAKTGSYTTEVEQIPAKYTEKQLHSCQKKSARICCLCCEMSLSFSPSKSTTLIGKLFWNLALLYATILINLHTYLPTLSGCQWRGLCSAVKQCKKQHTDIAMTAHNKTDSQQHNHFNVTCLWQQTRLLDRHRLIQSQQTKTENDHVNESVHQSIQLSSFCNGMHSNMSQSPPLLWITMLEY